MKLDTSEERYTAVRKLFARAVKIDNSFRMNVERVHFNDVFGLMIMMEKLCSLEDSIATERILENSLNKMLDVKDESDTAREKFIGIFGDGVKVFLQDVLIRQIDFMIDFAANEFGDRQLVKLQKDFRKTMTALRERYGELYKI